MRSPRLEAGSLNLRVGELVEVRSEEEILATLDENGTVGGLPFMPEMLEFCGKRFSVAKRADKTCDTINYSGSRRMLDTVHLEGMRCSGQAHGGCQALCSILWKEAWLRRVRVRSSSIVSNTSHAEGTKTAATGRTRCDRQRLMEATQHPRESKEGEVRYRCQATDILRASLPLPWWDMRQYLRDVRSGNVGAIQVVRAVLFRGFRKLLNSRWIRGYRAMIWSYNRLQSWRGGTPYPHRSGTLEKTPQSTLDLKVGELIRVKSQQDILKTVDKRNRNRGLSFDPEMVRYCGGVHRVLSRVERIINERTGKMIELPRDCIILEGAYCRAEYSHKRLFCPRSLYSFWREIWLERLDRTEGDQAIVHSDVRPAAASRKTADRTENT